MNVVWSNTSVNTYLHIIDFILENWTNKEVAKFQKAVNKLIQQLTENSKLCPESQILNFRKCVVSKQTSLIYTIENNTIYLITFIDNRALHKY